jgi:hypothetical protein
VEVTRSGRHASSHAPALSGLQPGRQRMRPPPSAGILRISRPPASSLRSRLAASELLDRGQARSATRGARGSLLLRPLPDQLPKAVAVQLLGPARLRRPETRPGRLVFGVCDWSRGGRPAGFRHGRCRARGPGDEIHPGAGVRHPVSPDPIGYSVCPGRAMPGARAADRRLGTAPGAQNLPTDQNGPDRGRLCPGFGQEPATVGGDRR